MRDGSIGRRELLKLGFGVAASAGLAALLPRAAWGADAASQPGKRRPNIIFILADDLGLDGVSCYGSDHYKTPNVDALAAGGVRFENGYCTPLCGPTRCQYLTGRYPCRTGATTNQNAGTPKAADEISVAKVLKDAGYATGHCGKWRQVGGTPRQWGFDEYLTDPSAGGVYWTKSYTLNDKLIQRDEQVYEPDEMFSFAVDFLTRNKEKPFFLYYAMHFVHVPLVKTPDSAGGEIYADNIAYMDKQVGQLMAKLDELKIRENTVVLFAGDNGTAQPARGSTIGGKTIHGRKGSMMEGGSHVPLIANWKGTTPAGKVAKDLADFSDLLPTFAELGGGKVPQDRPIDGHSFAPLLAGQDYKPREWIFVQLGQKWFARDAKYKLNESGELFDLNNAPFEEKLIAADAPDADAAAARKRLQAALDELKPKAIGAAGPASRPLRQARQAARRAQRNATQP